MADPNYQPFHDRFESRGLVARRVIDAGPQAAYMNLKNLEVRREGALSSRLGRKAITTNPAANNLPLTDLVVHTLGRMRGLLGATYRYAGAGQNLYRRAGDTQGAYAKINGSTALSGNRFSIVNYRPNNSSSPYAFFADGAAMLKDNGNLATAQRWGILPPPNPVTAAIGAPATVLGEGFQVDSGFTYGSTHTLSTRVNTILGTATTAGAIQTVTPAAMTNIADGMLLTIDSGGPQESVLVLATTATTFTAYFVNAHSGSAAVLNNFIQTGNLPTNSTTYISKVAAINFGTLGGQPSTDSDVVNLFIYVTQPVGIQEIRLLFDVGDGSFGGDYYAKSIQANALQQFVSSLTHGTEAAADRVAQRAAASVDFRRVGYNYGDIAPPDDPVIASLRPAPLYTGNNTWTRVQVKLSEFVKVGRAGTPGHDWSAINSFRVAIVSNFLAAGLQVGLDDLYLFGGSGLDSFAAGQYDWRYTYYDINTGDESNPSPEMIAANYLSPRRQPAVINWSASADPQVTHVRVYRRGGTLPDNWNLVGQIPIGTTTWTDDIPDSIAQAGEILALDNDVPVTSTLPVPVNTTLGTSVVAGATQTVTPAAMTSISANQPLAIGSGTTQETVIVQATTATTFTAFFQYPHGSTDAVYGTTVVGQPLPLAAIAFNRCFWAGDPNNPHFLYYSKAQNPSAAPPQNFVEIGTPSDPIQAIIATRGLLFVFTVSRIYEVLGAGAVPTVVPTASSHGMATQFAWCQSDGLIWFMGPDGVYVFAGSAPQCASVEVDWIFKGLGYGPVVAADPGQFSSMALAQHNNDVFIAYTGTDGKRYRLIWSTLYRRWRNDDQPANAMLVEEDTNTLVFGDAAGMIWQDRVNDYDSGGYSAGVEIKDGIAVALQTFSNTLGTPQNPKVFNELTIDAMTSGQNLTAALIFDQGATAQTVGTLNQSARAQQVFAVNGGHGYESRDIALSITGSITQVVDLYEFHAKSVLEQELRLSFDTYWQNLGQNDWKLCKEGFFEYAAPDAGGIVFSVYLDGSASATFSFSLPQSVQRNVFRVRFPALKFRLWRMIGTSAAPFQIYPSSRLSIKPVNRLEGYTQIHLVS